MRNLKKIFIASFAVFFLAGCSSEKEVETEEQTEIITEIETESMTEGMISLTNLQSSVLRTGKEGVADYCILTTDGEREGNFSFIASSDGFQAYSDDIGTNVIYSDEQVSAYLSATSWIESEAGFADIWSYFYSSECSLENDMVIIGEIPCYHVSVSDDDSSATLFGFCEYEGYTDMINGTIQYDFYISSDDHSMVRIDVSMPFLGMINEGDQKAELTVSFKITGTTNPVFDPPQIDDDQDTDGIDTASASYVAGTIIAEKNLYQNNQFGIQIAGNSCFNFDPEYTQTIQNSYEANGSNYRQEAYGKGDNLIISISSVSNQKNSAEENLADYLSDSGALEVLSSGTIYIGDNLYISSSATINQSKTMTYCKMQNDTALFITAYYKNNESLDEFKQCLFSSEDDPFWKEDSWILQEKYEFVTPKGYSIVKEDSTTLYTVMKSKDYQVNIFAIEGGSVENEKKNDTESTDTVTRKIISEETIQLDAGEDLYCAIVENTEQSYQYYTYIGLLKRDTAVIKFYMVNTANITESLSSIYINFIPTLQD